MRVQINGRRRDIGPGEVRHFSLRNARLEAAAIKKLAASGVDPLEERRPGHHSDLRSCRQNGSRRIGQELEERHAHETMAENGFVRPTWQASRASDIVPWMSRKSRALPPSPFRRFNPLPELIRQVVMLYVRFPLSLRNVEDLLFERGYDLCHETVRLWWNRFGPLFASEIRRRRVNHIRGFRHWRWHLDEMYVKLNGEMVNLWRAVDHGARSSRAMSPRPGTKLRPSPS